jgi:leucine-zipper-like transcriptional regulator 1
MCILYVQDVNVFTFATRVWSQTLLEGCNPIPRDSHISVIYGNSMFVYGGSTGSATDDFQELRLFPGRQMWVPIRTDNDTGNDAPPYHPQSGGGNDVSNRYLVDGFVGHYSELVGVTTELTDADYGGSPARVSGGGGGGGAVGVGSGNLIGFSRTGFSGIPPPPPPPPPPRLPRSANQYAINSSELLPGSRFCHVACVYEDCMYVFGGYDGSTRLGDFIRFRFGPQPIDCSIPPSSLLNDLKDMLDNKHMSDITFLVEGVEIYAHKILCSRCPVLNAMLNSEMIEGSSSSIAIHDVRHTIFLSLMEYLYTDDTQVTLENAMELFQVADRFGVERLKRICENLMLSSLNIENAAHILFTADLYDAKGLRERCIAFIVAYFNAVSKTQAFEEVGRANINLGISIQMLYFIIYVNVNKYLNHHMFSDIILVFEVLKRR